MEREGGENERRGEGAVIFAMQVLEIPAGGRGFPLVTIILRVKLQVEEEIRMLVH